MFKGIILLFGLMQALAFAAEEATTPLPAAPPKAPIVRGTTLLPSDKSDKFYPREIADKGIQGDVLVHALLGADGKATELTVKRSSRAKELDDLAVNYVRELTFKTKENAALPAVLVPIEFARDTTESLLQKPCGEFNVDYAYFRSAFPEKESADMRIIQLSSGIVYVTLSTNQVVKIAKARKEVNQATIAKCAENPSIKYFDTYLEEVKRYANPGSN